MTDTPPDDYRYTSLTAAIDDKHSPLRRYLDATFPNTRVISTPHARSSPPLHVLGAPGVNPGTVGTAFDVLIGLRYQPDTIPPAARPFARWRPDLAEGWANILNEVAGDKTLIEAAAWAYALAIEAYRSPVMPYPIADLLDTQGGYNEHDLLAIATAEAIEQLASLEELAETHLYPHLGPPPATDNTTDPGWRRTAAWSDPDPGNPPKVFGPTFTASALCDADADLICEGTLYEFKTRLGTKRTHGSRADALPTVDLYQAIAYTLFDTHNQHDITAVAFYSARYGRHTRWPLDDLLSTLAGRPISLGEERQTVWRLLGGEPDIGSSRD